MNQVLRGPSARPELVVSEYRTSVYEPVNETVVGFAGPLGRYRVVAALPLGSGPQTLLPEQVVHDEDTSYVCDPNGYLLGFPGIRVSRMLTARWTEDTRRLGG